MSTSLKRKLQTLSLLMLLSMAGCKSGCNPSEKTSPSTDPIQLAGTGHTYVEMTAAAAAPNGNGPCKNGMILVASGSAGGQPPQLLMGNVEAPFPSSYDLAGWDETQSKWLKRGNGALEPPPTATTEAPEGSDNQLARLANGDLLLMWNGSTKSPLPGSSRLPWWDNWGTDGNVIPDGLKSRFPDGKRNGYRAAQVFWRYSCTTGSWSPTLGLLDGGLAQALDANNKLQPGYCVESAPWVKGFDRPELYVDPFAVDAGDNSKQRMYVSTRCSRSDDDSTQVFASPDSGKSWEPSGIRLAAVTPVVMTSTVNGRLLLMQPLGATPTLHWSDNHGKSVASPPGGYDITYVVADPKPGEQSKYPIEWLAGDVTGVGEPGAATLSLARTGNNAAMAVYPAVEKVMVKGKQISRQVAAVVWVLTKGKDQEPIVVPIKIIRAHAEEGSVLMATFVEDDSPSQKLATSLLYWVETTSRPTGETDAVKMLARYVVFSGVIPSKEGVLSDAVGWETKNRKKYDAMGDYMKGAFYSQGGTLNFVAVWPQVPTTVASKDRTQVYMRVISFVPDNASVQPAPEKMAGARPAPRVSSTAKPVRVHPLDLQLRTKPNVGK